jgi:iron complex outermembrane recepter protein
MLCARAFAQDLDGGVALIREDAAVAPALLAPALLSIDASVPEPKAVEISVRHRRPAGPGEFEPGGTASKMNVPLEQLPSTVLTVEGKQLAERGVVDMAQALSLVPGVNALNTYGGFLSINSRGFQAMTMFDGRRDGRSTLFGSAPQMGLYDVERIEVLRGPASVLYGFGLVGGAVNVIRRRASPISAHDFEFGLGLPRQLRAHVGSQGAITKRLSYRVDLGHVTYENFRSYRSQRSQATVDFRYRPSSRDTFNVRSSLAFDRYNTDTGIPTFEDPQNPGVWVLPAGVRYATRYNSRNDYYRYQRLELSADYRHDFTDRLWAELRGSISKDEYEYMSAESLTYAPPTATTTAQIKRSYLGFDRYYRPLYVSAELHGDFETGAIGHKAVLGYSLDSLPSRSNRLGLNGAKPGDVSFAHPVDDPAPIEKGRTAIDRRRIAVHSFYLFDHITLWKGLFLTGGGRVDILRNRTRYQPLDLETQTEIPNAMTGQFYRANVLHDRAFTGQIGLVVNPWQPLTGYLGYNTAYKPFFVGPQATEIIKYTPERSQQFEGGLRVRADHKRHAFSLDAAGYLIRKKNLLVPRGMDDFTQAGLAQSRGLDLSARYRAPAYVELEGGYALTDAEYKEFIGSNPVTGNMMDDFSGNTLQLAPRHMGTVWARFFPTERLQLGVGSRMVGSQFADDLNRLTMPSYALLDASLTFSTEHATFILSANNLLNRIDYFNSVIRSGSIGPQLTPGAGREVLATIRLKL